MPPGCHVQRWAASWRHGRTVRNPVIPPHGGLHETEPPTVYADGFAGCLYPGKPEDVACYDAVFTDVRKRSLDEDAARRLITEVAEDYVQH
ncbi:Scr1 family TA system antitoxin-like transcriptional regulator [Streptomyces albus]|uniref:Scr1 family TA system antitoxin-like transcriptional regulator n=1 Tax=Streptomyces albus TaxID=1888 RepID=UPI0036FB7B19